LWRVVWGARAHQRELTMLEYFYGGNSIFYDFYCIFALEVGMDVNGILFTEKILFWFSAIFSENLQWTNF
jgi:hypothetical protein